MAISVRSIAHLELSRVAMKPRSGLRQGFWPRKPCRSMGANAARDSTSGLSSLSWRKRSECSG